MNQWNIGVQREITSRIVLEAAYVGNRGVWLEANNLVSHNATSLTRLQELGLDLNNPADRTLLTSRIDSALAASRGFKAPYAGYPGSATVAQTLRPFPQFNDGLAVRWAPLGSTWYDALQLNLTQRQWHSLSLTAAFTWQRELALGSGGNPSAGGGPTNNVFDRAAQKGLAANSQPYIFVTSFNYITPRPAGKVLGALLGDWTVAGLLRYASGALMPVPGAQNNLGSLIFQGTRMNRVEGQPLFVQDPELPLHRSAQGFRAESGRVVRSRAGTVRDVERLLRRLPVADAGHREHERWTAVLVEGPDVRRGARGVLQHIQPDVSPGADRLQQQSAVDADLQLERRAFRRLRLHQPDRDAERAAEERPDRGAVPVLSCSAGHRTHDSAGNPRRKDRPIRRGRAAAERSPASPGP